MTAPIDSNSRLYLVDGSGYIFRAYHALPPLTRPRDGLPVGAVAGFCNMLYKLLNDLKEGERPTHLAVVFDKSEQTFRSEIYPQYKAQRPPAPEDLIPQFALIREATRAFGAPAVEMDGYEADDLIATYARDAARRGAKVQIVSSDKDLMQLIEDGRIELYDPMKQKPLGPEAVVEKFGVGPDKVIDVQALMGDSVDNVPGAPGIGQKTAAELINTYGSLDALLERAAEIKQPKRRETLLNFAEQIRISRTLVTLKDDVAVEDALESFAVRDFEDGVLLKFLDDMEFKTLGRRVREQLAKEPEKLEPQGASAEPDADKVDYEAYVGVETAEALQTWIERAKALGVIAAHTETKVRSPVCEDLVGVALALGSNDACYVPLAHTAAPPADGPADLFSLPEPLDLSWRKEALALLKPLLEDPTVLKVGHDIKTAIDAFAVHGIRIAPYDCTLCISYALGGGLHEHDLASLAERHFGHALIGFGDVAGKGKAQVTFDRVPVAAAVRYSAEDADIALRLWKKLKPGLARERLRTVYETLERPLPGVLADMEREGVKVDVNVLSRLSGDFAQRMAGMEAEAEKLVGRPFNIGSPKQIGDILFGEMGLPGGSKTKTGAWSTDASVLEDLADQGHELPRVALDWRQLQKLRSTYTEALKEVIDPKSKRIHTTYALGATTTGRLSSLEPNLQNIPIRTEEGRRIREAFVAEPGHVLVSADYSQIELRLLAHVADIPQLRQAFRDGLDIHALTASEMFGVPVEGMDPMVRRQAKAINFGIIYGISAFGLARNLGIERGEADAYIKRYFERFPGIRDYMDATKAYARANGFVKTIFGRRCWIADIKARIPTQRAFAERQAINAPLQGAAADIIRRAMARLPTALAREGLRTRMLLQVHDELVFEAPEAEAEAAAKLVKSVMEGAAEPAVSLAVPLTVDARWGRTWAEAH
jgi:DNA polymerase-1